MRGGPGGAGWRAVGRADFGPSRRWGGFFWLSCSLGSAGGDEVGRWVEQ